jgi:hypothetical protein
MPPGVPGDHGKAQLDDEQCGEAETERPVARDPRPQFGEIDVEHHHDEQEQDGDGADVDDDQKEGEKLGPISRNRPAALKKARISQSTLCTGLRDPIVITPEAMTRVANR